MQSILRNNHMLSHNNTLNPQNSVIPLSQCFLRHLHRMLNKNHTFTANLLISQYPFQCLKDHDTGIQKCLKHNDLAKELSFFLLIRPVFLQIVNDQDDLMQNWHDFLDENLCSLQLHQISFSFFLLNLFLELFQDCLLLLAFPRHKSHFKDQQ